MYPRFDWQKLTELTPNNSSGLGFTLLEDDARAGTGPQLFAQANKTFPPTWTSTHGRLAFLPNWQAFARCVKP